MIRANRHRWILLAFALAVGGCAGVPDSLRPDPGLVCTMDRGLGGTGAVRNIALDRGLGGTGIDRGMGGTGIYGVLGTVTGFGSICVNGLHVSYDTATPTRENGTTVATDLLERGTTVAVTAMATGAQNGGPPLHAQSIEILHALQGPVTSPVDGSGVLTVMDVRIDAALTTGVDITSLAVGDIVTVDGLARADGVIEATRIVKAQGDARAFVRGQAAMLAGTARVGTIPLALPATQVGLTSGLGGAWVTAEGTFVNHVFIADKIAAAEELAGVAGGRVSVEGYLVPRGNTFAIRGIDLRDDPGRGLGADLLNRLASGQRVQVIGVKENDGALRIQRIVVPQYESPLREAAADSATTTRPAAQTRQQLQQQRGTYSATVTRPNVTDDAATVLRSQTPTRPQFERPMPPQRPEAPQRPEPPQRPGR